MDMAHKKARTNPGNWGVLPICAGRSRREIDWPHLVTERGRTPDQAAICMG